jgi:hypothetical protein
MRKTMTGFGRPWAAADYLSQFPTKVIVPAPGVHLSGRLYDPARTVGVTFVF